MPVCGCASIATSRQSDIFTPLGTPGSEARAMSNERRAWVVYVDVLGVEVIIGLSLSRQDEHHQSGIETRVVLRYLERTCMFPDQCLLVLLASSLRLTDLKRLRKPADWTSTVVSVGPDQCNAVPSLSYGGSIPTLGTRGKSVSLSLACIYHILPSQVLRSICIS